MGEKIIGDPKLLELFEKNKVAFEIGEPDQFGLRPICIIFPDLQQLPGPEDLICPPCQKPARVVLENDIWNFSGYGLFIEFQNIRKFQVKGCLADLIEDSVKLKEFARWSQGYHSSVVDLENLCINDRWDQGQAETIGWALTVMIRAFASLCPRPPDIDKIKSALQYSLS